MKSAAERAWNAWWDPKTKPNVTDAFLAGYKAAEEAMGVEQFGVQYTANGDTHTRPTNNRGHAEALVILPGDRLVRRRMGDWEEVSDV